MSAFELRDLVERPVAVVRATVAIRDLPAFFERAFHAVGAVMSAQGVHPIGPPFGLYRGMPDPDVDVAAGFPVSDPIQPSGDVIPDRLPGGHAVVTTHVGPFDRMDATYEAMGTWMAGQGFEGDTTMWENYLSDPSVEPDPARWRTEIVWPVAVQATSTR